MAKIEWTEDGKPQRALWQSEAGLPPPPRVVLVDDTTTADDAYRWANAGTAMLWRGDYHNARQLVDAMARRIDRQWATRKVKPGQTMLDTYHLFRLAQAQRARTLGKVLVQLLGDHTLQLRRAPDVRQACMEVLGERIEPYVLSLRELLGVIGAHQWRHKGVFVQALGRTVHPHYGLFAPVRDEYVDLVAQAPLPATELAFDIGTGTGVLTAVLAQRGVQRVIATDVDPRAIACARDNLDRMGMRDVVDVQQCDLFPPGRAPLVVCNPPWLPGKPSAPMERAIYDPDSQMLRGFLAGLRAHLTPDGQGWLVLSDLAEHIGLRSRATLLGWMADAGLQVLGRLDARPRHPKAKDTLDPLHAARAAEVTSLWRLGLA